MSKEKMKGAFEALLEWTKANAARTTQWFSRAIIRAKRSLADYGAEIERRTAPVVSAARRGNRRIAEISRPVTRPLRSGLGRLAPLIARIPLVIGAIGLTVIDAVASVIEGIQRAFTDRLLPALARAVDTSSRALTPTRIGGAACLIAAGLLIGSQFLDYRGVAVGAALYKGQIAVDAPAPITATAVAGDAHLWVMIPIAVVAAVVAYLSLRTGNRRLGLLICGLGLVAVAVTLAVDLPKGLDPVNALPYSDASVRLLGGFWAELFAALALIASGGVLMRGDSAKPTRQRTSSVPRGAGLAAARSN